MTGGHFVKPSWIVHCDTCGAPRDLCGPRPEGRKFDLGVGSDGKRIYRCIECQDAVNKIPWIPDSAGEAPPFR